jgi:hypothetical protein
VPFLAILPEGLPGFLGWNLAASSVLPLKLFPSLPMDSKREPMRRESEVERPAAEQPETRSPQERRRTERVFLQVAVFVQGVTPDGHAFREKTHTLAVNVHGALIHLAEDVRIDDRVTLTHSITGQQQTCRVVYTQPFSGNIRAVGIEFESPTPRFWQIAFPPSNWKPFLE